MHARHPRRRESQREHHEQYHETHPHHEETVRPPFQPVKLLPSQELSTTPPVYPVRLSPRFPRESAADPLKYRDFPSRPLYLSQSTTFDPTCPPKSADFHRDRPRKTQKATNNGTCPKNRDIRGHLPRAASRARRADALRYAAAALKRPPRSAHVPEWRNGRRRGFKIPRPSGHEGSSPSSGTMQVLYSQIFTRPL